METGGFRNHPQYFRKKHMTKLDQLGENWRDLWTKLRLFLKKMEKVDDVLALDGNFFHDVHTDFLLSSKHRVKFQEDKKQDTMDMGRLYMYIFIRIQTCVFLNESLELIILQQICGRKHHKHHKFEF